MSDVQFFIRRALPKQLPVRPGAHPDTGASFFPHTDGGQAFGEVIGIVKLRWDDHFSRGVDEAPLATHTYPGQSLGKTWELVFIGPGYYDPASFVDQAFLAIFQPYKSKAFSEPIDKIKFGGDNELPSFVNKSILLANTYGCQSFGKAISIIKPWGNDNSSGMVNKTEFIALLHHGQALGKGLGKIKLGGNRKLSGLVKEPPLSVNFCSNQPFGESLDFRMVLPDNDFPLPVDKALPFPAFHPG